MTDENKEKIRQGRLKRDLLEAVTDVNALLRHIEIAPGIEANLSFPMNDRNRYLDVAIRIDGKIVADSKA